jgi:hypothetical protein
MPGNARFNRRYVLNTHLYRDYTVIIGQLQGNPYSNRYSFSLQRHSNAAASGIRQPIFYGSSEYVETFCVHYPCGKFCLDGRGRCVLCGGRYNTQGGLCVSSRIFARKDATPLTTKDAPNAEKWQQQRTQERFRTIRETIGSGAESVTAQHAEEAQIRRQAGPTAGSEHPRNAMMRSRRSGGRADILPGALLGIAAVLAITATANPAVAEGFGRLAELGRRIYIDGILPDGTPLKATRFEGDSVITGAEAACANCHRRSGYGSIEGKILVPPVAGAALFAPGAFAPAASAGRGNALPAPAALVERFRRRSAYNEQNLRRVLHEGLDPDGKPLQPLMGRYDLDAYAVKALAAYLRQLSDESVPGITSGIMHLGTVISPDVPLPQREALVEVLRTYAATRESWGMRWQVHVWQLTGEPREWEAQLEEHYRQQPVFALLSGAGTFEWSPVHRFCERHAVPCMLPSVEIAPDPDQDYYSIYFSTGLVLEAQLLAHYLAADSRPPRRIVQVVADDSGARAASALREALGRAGSTIAAEQVTPGKYAALAPLAAEDAVVWWLRPTQLAELTAKVPDSVPPASLFVSAVLAPPEELVMPDGWKQSVRMVSFFDTLASQRVQATLIPWLARHGIAETDLRLRGDAYAACSFLNAAITSVQKQQANGIYGPLTRERLLEALESGMTVFRDDGAPYYWRLSLGPGQRLPVKGGLLLRYAGSNTRDLVPLTARIVP